MQGLHSATRVAELLRRAAEAIGVQGVTNVALRCELRFLRPEDTLEDVGISVGGVVDVCVVEGGGMPGGAGVPAGAVGTPAQQAATGSSSMASMQGFTQSERFTEAEEEQELRDYLFDEIDTDKSGTISRAELMAALGKRDMQTELKEILTSLIPASSASVGQDSVTREAFGKAFEALPRVRGELVSWVRGLRLEEQLARVISKLRRGDLFDGLRGLKELEDGDLEPFVKRVAGEFSAVLEGVLLAELRQLRASGSRTAISHVNSKFCLDGAYVGQFATLNDFFRGPEVLIGTPNPKVLEGLETEHCRRRNADTEFTTPNYNVTTTPRLEWEFVVCPRAGFRYAHTPKDKSRWPANSGWKGEEGRDIVPLETFMEMQEVKQADLKKSEVTGMRLYTGPTYVLYNARLRGFPAREVALLEGNEYETTIFIISSGITKLSKLTGLPKDRLLYRGLGGLILPRQFWEEFDECQATLVLSPTTVSTTCEEITQHIKGRSSACATAAVAPAAKTPAFELGSSFLQLDLKGEAAAKLGAGRGVRVVKPPSPWRQGAVRMVVALPISQFDFTQSMQEEFKAALIAACGGGIAVRVEEIANKPYDFRGGGISPLPPHHSLHHSSRDRVLLFALKHPRHYERRCSCFAFLSSPRFPIST